MYHSVSAKYLQTYLDEYCFLFNRRRSSNLLFRAILERVSEMASYGAMKNARERLPRRATSGLSFPCGVSVCAGMSLGAVYAKGQIV